MPHLYNLRTLSSSWLHAYRLAIFQETPNIPTVRNRSIRTYQPPGERTIVNADSAAFLSLYGIGTGHRPQVELFL